MNTKHYAVIGHPIGHTMSPFIHKRLFELSGIDADYGIIDIAPENLATVYAEKLKKLGWKVFIIWECQIRHGDAQMALKHLEHLIITD